MTATAPVPKSRCLPAAAAPAPPGPAVPPRGCGCARPLLLPPPIRGLRRCRPFPFPPGPRRSRHHGQDQGPRPAGEKEGGAAEAAGRPQGGAVTAARGKGDGRGRLQAVQNPRGA